jgi:hypothetical protein
MSKVQFNLLPDSKLAFNRSQHNKRLALTISSIAVIISVGLLLMLLVLVDGVQKKLMSDAATKVDKSTSKLQSLNIDDIVTVQNQLQTLTSLHQSKHISSRIFQYLPEVTPPDVSINRLDLDLTLNKMSISGTAASQKSVNTFVDTLKVAKYKIGSDGKSLPAFNSVVESGFNLSGAGVGYTIDMQFDPQLFVNGLKDSQGHPLTPQISVNSLTTGNNTQDPSKTLFNSTQSGTGNQ